MLTKWGEYSNDVQFILQRSETSKNFSTNRQIVSPIMPSTPSRSLELLDKLKDSPEKKLNLSSGPCNSADNVGIVKGVPHLRSNEDSSPKKSSESSESPSHRHPPVPPPYRDPPPPTSSINYDKFKKPQESHKVKDSQYKELISLVNYQREKLTTQEVDLNKVRLFCYKTKSSYFSISV